MLCSLKALFLTTVLPSQKLHGSEVASQNVIDALRYCGCSVKVLGYSRKEDGNLEMGLDEVLVAERSIETSQLKYQPALWFFQSMLQRSPYSSTKYQSQDYFSRLRKLLSIHKFDIIIFDHSQMGWLMPFISKLSARPYLIFMAHNIEHEIYQQHQRCSTNSMGRWVYGREAKLIQNMEDCLAKAVDQVWTLTQHDANYFTQVSPKSDVFILSLPAAFEGQPKIPGNKSYDIGIIGSWPWKPNEEGLRWFLNEIYPLLPSDLSVHVAGRGADWLIDNYPKITYRNFVPDAQQFMAEAKVIVIPTLSGGGIQIKTLDAIASGTRIVATSIALRGIVQPPETVKVADDPQTFSQHIHSALAEVNSISNSQEMGNLNIENMGYVWCHKRKQQFHLEVHQAVKRLKP